MYQNYHILRGNWEDKFWNKWQDLEAQRQEKKLWRNVKCNPNMKGGQINNSKREELRCNAASQCNAGFYWKTFDEVFKKFDSTKSYYED
jgi:hypothetical protein